MKQIFFISFLLCLVQLCSGQSSSCDIDNDYFLLGTLSDYMGREKYQEIDERVDEYYTTEKSLASFILNTFKDKHSDLYTRIDRKTQRSEMYSKSLTEMIDDLYTYKPSGRAAYKGDKDLMGLNLDSLTKTKDFYATNFDTIYTGSLRKDVFKNNVQKLSFIAGAFERFGGYNDSIYYISVANSVSKVKISAYLLKELNCSNIEYKVKKGYIPVGHKVYFKPTDELKLYFETIKQKLSSKAELKKE